MAGDLFCTSTYTHYFQSSYWPLAFEFFKWIQSWLMLEQVGQSLNSSSRITSRLTNTAHSLRSNSKPKSFLLWPIESWTLYFCFNLVYSAATNNDEMSLVWPFFKQLCLVFISESPHNLSAMFAHLLQILPCTVCLAHKIRNRRIENILLVFYLMTSFELNTIDKDLQLTKNC